MRDMWEQRISQKLETLKDIYIKTTNTMKKRRNNMIKYVKVKMIMKRLKSR